jgi:hypothetical protein
MLWLSGRQISLAEGPTIRPPLPLKIPTFFLFPSETRPESVWFIYDSGSQAWLTRPYVPDSAKLWLCCELRA